MGRRIAGQAKTSNLAPGTIVHIGDTRTEKVGISVMHYSKTQVEERELKKANECIKYKGRVGVTWINVSGIHDRTVIEEMGSQFGLHPLLLEDMANTEQRPKLEDYGKYLFIVLKVLRRNEKLDEINVEQISLVLGVNFVISFQEHNSDLFEAVKGRIRNNKGKMRIYGADYLAYSLIDAIVDSYFVLLETTGEKIEEIENELVSDPSQKTLKKIHRSKREMIFLRRSIWPLREVIGGMGRGGSALINEITSIYLRDVYDHIIQVIDTVETFRDMLSGTMDIYLSSVNNKMNEIMKVLTVIATIFIPLTFITGVYGMNFEFMPELHLKYGYEATLAGMLIIAGSMLVYFHKKHWM